MSGFYYGQIMSELEEIKKMIEEIEVKQAKHDKQLDEIQDSLYFLEDKER